MRSRRRVQCEASLKTPDSHYWQCQRAAPHDGRHWHGIVQWEGTADPATRTCGSTFCPGGPRAGEVVAASDLQ